MEKCRNLTPCTLELLDDPALKTTAANYDFKYVPGEQFQKVIRTVQRDRLKHKKDSIWSEFCHYKRRPTIVNVKEKDSVSKYEVKPHQDHRNIIKTKTSTIKIISTPMVENKSDNQESPSPEESYRTYKVPKVRIMTDEEIKNVVESAFKEVMEQTGNSQIVNQLQTSRQEKKKPDGEKVETIRERSFEQQPTTLPEEGETTQISARSIKTSRSINTARSMKTARSSVLEAVSQEVTSPSIDLMEDLHSSPYYETNTEVVQLVKVSARSQLSTRSIDSSKTIETSKSSERTSELDEQDTIQPLVRIRQPTPRRVMLKLEEDVIIKPIKSSSTIQKKSARIAESPRKRVPLSARVNTPRINKESHVKSPEKSSKVSLIPLRPSPAVTPRTPKKKKNASPAVISDIRQHELKQENILLMAKIMGHLQKITQTIERIRDNLDDIPEPDGNLDLKRRERRAEEFTARFARNYLYQISRLMEEIRVIPKEQCLSKSDNDFPMKVCNLFSTLNQAIQSYMKHMSSFIVDQNPKKLGTLLEVITEATKLCVHKKILEKADATVHEVLRKAKSLKTCLHANQEKSLQIPQLKQKKAKSQKPQKGEADAPKPARKLSMYDTIPTNLAATKRKSGHSLKGTARSKTSIRSLMPKSSCDSRAAFHKSEKRINQKIASTRVPSKPSLPSPTPHPARIEESESKEDELSIESPHIDNVNTQIETVRSEDMQDELTPKSGENLVKDIIANVNEGQNIDSMHSAERDKDINNTVIEALESITKQQVQQILGPLMSNLGAFVSNKVIRDLTSIHIYIYRQFVKP
ncbi:uncharacterized protein LOC119658066 isoform X2 [Hermetia illucens]|uniref:uncharacterized protein LOC119658066 isoform X2 n=1 Tax=Hermetia illucens TaxID=343691 RepID=UPI0018CC1C7F|nr:uncharacterized protein LOC119658066 isoform X2 [Hermetia illucens]